MAGVVAVAAGGEEANHDDGRDGGVKHLST